MSNSDPMKVSEFIRDIQSTNPEQAKILEFVKDLFNEIPEELSQGIKYGGLVYFQKDELIGGIFPYRKHLSIEFSNGADFTDPLTLLEGNGKRRRHLKIHTLDEVDTNNVSFFVRQATGKGTENQ